VILKEIHTLRPEFLDQILTQCLQRLMRAQRHDAHHWGLVSAAVLGPQGQLAYGVNHRDSTGHRIHAEAVALHQYIQKHGEVDQDCVIITTLSPCSLEMVDRAGPSCTDLINHLGISRVYCGYQDPTQPADPARFRVQCTGNRDIRDLCKKIADTFLKP